MNKSILTFIFLSLVFSAYSQSIKKQKNKIPKKLTETVKEKFSLDSAISPIDYQTSLGIGIDVIWAESKKGIETFNSQMVKDFKSSGLSHIRIRVKDEPSQKLLAHVDSVITKCLANNLIPVLAFHGGEFEEKPNEVTMKKSIEWWSVVSNYFKDKTHKLSFDLIIEVTDELNKENDLLNDFYEKATTAIRKTNPKRIIMISPRVRSQPENLKDLKIPTQHNNYLMAEWHFYASGPDKSNPLKKWTTGTEDEKELIRKKIRIALEWSNNNNIPTWVGAWMAGNYNKGDDYSIDEQVKFAKFVSCELKTNKIPFAFNADHKYYNSEKNQWISKMLPVYNAIVKSECK